MLVDRAKSGKRDIATFKFFIQTFRATMDNPDASSKEITLAVRGYGYFAKVRLCIKDMLEDDPLVHMCMQ